MTARPDLVRELLEGPYPCCLTTLRDEGDPYAVVVWCAPEGDAVTVNATEGRWLANIRRDPRVSLVVVDTAEILRHVGIDGRVVAIEPDRTTPTSTPSPSSTRDVPTRTRPRRRSPTSS